MPKLTVPTRYRAGISRIQKLNDSEIARLRDAIKKAVGGSAFPAIRTSVLAPQIAESDLVEPRELAETIASLYRVKSGREVSLEQFTSDIADSLNLTGTDRDQLVKNITALLGIDEVGLASKAWDLQTEDERTFCDGRILTDLRPVFGPEISQGPKAMVIVHLLKLGYHDAGTAEGHKDFYISLDADDLDTLSELVERAKRKADVLKTSIANFRYLGRS